MATDINDTDWLRALRARRKKLSAQIADLQKQLRHLEDLEAHATATPAPEARKADHPKRKAPPAKHGDFRNKVREVMRGAARPLRPAEVTKILRDNGVENPGSSDMNSRIATELYKLKLAGELKKTADGYVLANAQ